MDFRLFGITQDLTVDDNGIRITVRNGGMQNRFLTYSKLVTVSVQKPSFLTPGHIFFRTVADSDNPLNSFNAVYFKGKDNYAKALEIQSAVENKLTEIG